MSFFKKSSSNNSSDADSKKGVYPRCGGPSYGICEAANCRNGTLPGYPAEHIRGYKNCPAMWECTTYKKYRDSM